MLAPFSTKFNVACLHIASKLFPLGYDVSDDLENDTYEALCERFNAGRVVVWSGGSAATIFGGPECAEANWAFRAWHDFHHWRGALPFTLEGEVRVAQRQQADILALYGKRDATDFCKLISEEVTGQAAYFAATGHFPADQRAFARQFLR